jgi:hypothetical protein
MSTPTSSEPWELLKPLWRSPTLDSLTCRPTTWTNTWHLRLKSIRRCFFPPPQPRRKWLQQKNDPNSTNSSKIQSTASSLTVAAAKCTGDVNALSISQASDSYQTQEGSPIDVPVTPKKSNTKSDTNRQLIPQLWKSQRKIIQQTTTWKCR